LAKLVLARPQGSRARSGTRIAGECLPPGLEHLEVAAPDPEFSRRRTAGKAGGAEDSAGRAPHRRNQARQEGHAARRVDVEVAEAAQLRVAIQQHIPRAGDLDEATLSVQEEDLDVLLFSRMHHEGHLSAIVDRALAARQAGGSHGDGIPRAGRGLAGQQDEPAVASAIHKEPLRFILAIPKVRHVGDLAPRAHVAGPCGVQRAGHTRDGIAVRSQYSSALILLSFSAWPFTSIHG
jgi:hypothetical protein